MFACLAGPWRCSPCRRSARAQGLPEGCNGAFRLDNRSSRAIRSIFNSGPAPSDTDFRDWLDDATLPPGLAMTFRGAGAVIDLTIMRDDGRRLQRRDIDICRLPLLLVTDSAITPTARS